jgi:hypothetical protein
MTRSRPSVLRPFASRAKIALAALLLVAACGDATGPDDEVRSALTRWRRTHPANYAYTLQRDCFWPQVLVRPVRIEVHGDAVHRLTDVATGEAVDPRWAEFFPTIDVLMVALQDAPKRADSFDAEYDRQYGYPHRVSIDYSRQMVDDESSLFLSDFTPLP